MSVISGVKSVINLAVKWFKDVFYDPTNDHLDNGRLLAYISIAAILVAAYHNMKLKAEIHLDQLGQGLGVVLTALVVYVYHDRKQNDAS